VRLLEVFEVLWRIPFFARNPQIFIYMVSQMPKWLN
jgi:hypothetical protein